MKKKEKQAYLAKIHARYNESGKLIVQAWNDYVFTSLFDHIYFMNEKPSTKAPLLQQLINESRVANVDLQEKMQSLESLHSVLFEMLEINGYVGEARANPRKNFRS